jgi:hypothetical protein
MQRNAILGGVAVVALVVAGYMFFGGPGRSGAVAEVFTEQAVCLACQREAEVSHRAGEAAPWKCPHCSEVAAYPWLYCHDCNKRFVPQLVPGQNGEPPRMPGFPRCPLCRGQNFGTFLPGTPGQEPTGDAPLPKWKP